MKSVIIAIMLLVLLGNSTLNVDRDKAASSRSDGKSIETTKGEKEIFSAHISVPHKIRANEEFIIKADLEVKTDHEFTMTSRKQMFTYTIHDSSGKPINTYVMTDVGIVRMSSGRETISEKYNYKIKEPGVYKVEAIAELTVDQGGNGKNYKISAEPETIIVTMPKQNNLEFN